METLGAIIGIAIAVYLLAAQQRHKDRAHVAAERAADALARKR